VRYELLGPLRIVSIDGSHTLTARKTETLLAALLIRCGQVVAASQLVAELWGEEPPRRAAAGLHVYVSQLRKFLAGIEGTHTVIETGSSGYTLHPGADEVDVHLFQDAMRRSRHQLRAGCAGQAARTLDDALALFGGPTPAGIHGGPIVSGFELWIEESRLECLEMQIRAHFSLNRHREMIGTLYSLIAQYPLREAFYHLLMLGLYRTGRQADALRVYQRARDVIVGELGLEPCRSLRELHQAILVEDSDADRRIPV
jgi:DNA-binding SARP family transcriptional activator